MVAYSKISCCRMEQPEELVEEFVEESSDEEVQVVLPVVQVEPLNVEVAGIPDNPESPSPQLDSPHPSPASAGGSPQHSPLIGGPPHASASGLSEEGFYLLYELLYLRGPNRTQAVGGGREGCPEGPGGSHRGARGLVQFEDFLEICLWNAMGD